MSTGTCQPASTGDALHAALTRAALAMGRLDQRLHAHPLLPAILFRERLEAARVCARVDGHVIDPWHLAAVLEGLRPRLPGEDALERGSIIDSATVAFGHYQWLARPSAEQAPQIRDALALLRAEATPVGPLLGAARGFHRWIDMGNSRAPMRSALIAFWQETRLLRVKLPLTAPQAFAAETAWEKSSWLPRFLTCLAHEAEEMDARIADMEHQWRHARLHDGACRSNSRAGTAIDLIAAFPLLSATSLADKLGVSVKTACILLDRFLEKGLVIEVTHRSARRLFALKGFEPLRDTVQPPRRPMPGRKRGRPRREIQQEPPTTAEQDRPLPPLVALQPPGVSYADLEDAIALVEAAISRMQTTRI